MDTQIPPFLHALMATGPYSAHEALPSAPANFLKSIPNFCLYAALTFWSLAFVGLRHPLYPSGYLGLLHRLLASSIFGKILLYKNHVQASLTVTPGEAVKVGRLSCGRCRVMSL